MHLICVIIIIEKIELRRIIYEAKKTADWFYYKEYLKAVARNEADFAIRLGYSWKKQTRDTLMLTISVVNDENDMRHDREISRGKKESGICCILYSFFLSSWLTSSIISFMHKDYCTWILMFITRPFHPHQTIIVS